jgi:hypothetical protein
MGIVSKVQWDVEGTLKKEDFIATDGRIFVIGYPDKERLPQVVKKIGKDVVITLSCFHYEKPLANGASGYVWPSELSKYLQ